MCKKGDIVRINNTNSTSTDRYYYVVNSIQDYSLEDDEKSDVDCELVLIFPVSSIPIIEIADRRRLELIASYASAEHKKLFDYIKKERNRLGLVVEPEYIKKFGIQSSSDKTVRKNVKTNKEDEGFTRRQFADLMRSNEGEKRIAENLEKVDKCLELLYLAIKNNDLKQIELYKKELEEIRRSLMELEHYRLSESKKMCNCPSCRGYYKRMGYNIT